jgi:hypothetical protein
MHTCELSDKGYKTLKLKIQGHDAALIGKQLMTFHRSLLPPVSGSKQCSKEFFDYLDPEDGGSKILQNVSNTFKHGIIFHKNFHEHRCENLKCCRHKPCHIRPMGIVRLGKLHDELHNLSSLHSTLLINK